MKNQKFDPKAFLNVEELSPLESMEVRGGIAKQKQKEKQKKKQKQKSEMDEIAAFA